MIIAKNIANRHFAQIIRVLSKVKGIRRSNVSRECNLERDDGMRKGLLNLHSFSFSESAVKA